MGMLARAVKNVTAAPEELAVGIRDQLALARAQLAELVRQQSEAAEASVTSPTAVADYERATAALDSANAEIARLETGLAAVERKAAEAARQRLLAEQAGLRERVGRILDQRLDVAKRFTGSLELLVRDFRELVELSQKAHVAFPRINGEEPPEAAALGDMLLVRFVAAELFRLGHVIPVTGREATGRLMPSLPGPKASFEFIEMPERIKPLADEIAECNRFAVATMEGRA
jgi:hypothetical protein